MKLIPLTQGKYAAVDDADYGWLMKFRWYAHKKPTDRTWYAYTHMSRITRNPIAMHTLLCPFAKRVDHINRNGLWNSRSNLRPATRSQNGGNAIKKRGNYTSSYKGVSWNNKLSKWTAFITERGNSKYLGLFLSETGAAKAYDKAVLKKWGEFALLNFPPAKT